MPVLDTCFVIDFLRGDEAATRLLGLLQQGSRPLGVGPHTEFELYQGIGRSRAPEAEKQRVDSFLAELVHFPFNSEAARTAGLLDAQLADRGRRPAILDLLIACTAMAAREPVVTRDNGLLRDIPGLEVLGY